MLQLSRYPVSVIWVAPKVVVPLVRLTDAETEGVVPLVPPSIYARTGWTNSLSALVAVARIPI